MELSKRRRRWISIFVGVVGLVTVVGLSDLIFVIPQQPTQQPVTDTIPVVAEPVTTSSSTPDLGGKNPVIPNASTTSTSSPNEFGL